MENLPIESFMSSFSFSSLVAGLIFGSVGLWIFGHGRKNANNRNIVIGLVLMIYPYFVSGAWLTWGLGLALCGYAYHTWYS
jgi:multisubunit Na+/H+ antiporter MnhE subunit